jgi:flagellar biosynthesis component FlhA
VSKEDNYETNFRKNLTRTGSGLLVGSILAGPAAPIFAAVGIGLILGRVSRSLFNKEARKEYKEEKDKEEVRKETQEDNPYMPESPETAIARRNPYLSKKLLEEMSKNEMYKRISEESVIIAGDYITQMREINPAKFARSNGMCIIVEEDVNKGLERFLFGKNSNGYKVNISLKEDDTK